MKNVSRILFAFLTLLGSIQFIFLQPGLAQTNAILDYGPATKGGVIRNKELIELSGVVSGGVNKGILWVHNDRQNLPRLFALNEKGETIATYSLNTFHSEEPDEMAGDWEDIARAAGKKEGSFDIYIGDIGNNPMEKREHRILVVSEPVIDSQNSSRIIDTEFKIIRFQFPENYVCNSECLLIHPGSKGIIIVSKTVEKRGEEIEGNFVWSLPVVKDFGKVYTAELVMSSIPATGGKNVTGGDISSDGEFLILRTKSETAYLWRLGKYQTLKQALLEDPKRITLADESGGEAICFALDKSKLFTVYDGKKKRRPLHVYRKK